MSGRPILVTGSNRSGTTWVGHALCQSDELEYLHEPFNSSIRTRLLERRPPGHYHYVCADNEAAWVGPVDQLLRYRFPVRAQLREVDSPRQAYRLARGWARSVPRRLRDRRPLLKDPIALFAAEWLAARFDAQVVVLVRHPAAFASSIKRLGWRFDARTWLDQPLLLRDHLGPMQPELERLAAGGVDLVDEAIILWNAFTTVIDDLAERHPDWQVLIYEELAEDPAAGFARLYPALGLRWDAGVAERVAAFSDEGNVKEVAAGDIGPTRRDSRAAKWTWVRRLTPEEVERVREGTSARAASWYDEASWTPPEEAAGSTPGLVTRP